MHLFMSIDMLELLAVITVLYKFSRDKSRRRAELQKINKSVQHSLALVDTGQRPAPKEAKRKNVKQRNVKVSL